MTNNLIIKEKSNIAKDYETITKDNLYLIKLMTILKKYQENMNQLEEKKLLFNWIIFPDRQIEMKKEGKIQTWLNSIKFSNILALILEEIHWNIDFVLENRKETFKYIYSDLHMTEIRFNKELKKLQKLLIESGKVKICENGMIIIMNNM